jgi:hypothetical protein
MTEADRLRELARQCWAQVQMTQAVAAKAALVEMAKDYECRAEKCSLVPD